MSLVEMRLECLKLAAQIAPPGTDQKNILEIAIALFEWLSSSNR